MQRSFSEPAGPAFAGWAVYILRCADETLYTGSTNDVAIRVARHNQAKGAKYTASRRPVTLVYQEALESRSAALTREAAIKAMSRAQKLALIEGRYDESR